MEEIGSCFNGVYFFWCSQFARVLSLCMCVVLYLQKGFVSPFGDCVGGWTKGHSFIMMAPFPKTGPLPFSSFCFVFISFSPDISSGNWAEEDGACPFLGRVQVLVWYRKSTFWLIALVHFRKCFDWANRFFSNMTRLFFSLLSPLSVFVPRLGHDWCHGYRGGLFLVPIRV